MEKRIMKVLFSTLRSVGRTGAIAGIIAALTLPPAAAVDPTDGRERPTGFGYVSASGIGPMPPAGSPINVEFGTDDPSFRSDPLYVQARIAALDSLRALGFEATDRGSPVLRIGVTMAPGPIRMFETPVGARPSLHPGEIAPIPDSDRVPWVQPQVRVPLGRRDRRPTGSYTVTLMLFERGKEPMWMATVAASGTVPEPEALVRALTRTAMNDLGRSVEREFVLSCEEEDVAQGSVCPE
jgi:hypothetical protein